MITTDISISKDQKIINDKFDFLLQEIELLFDTSKGEVLGEYDFGTDFESFIWDLSIDNNAISDYVVDKIKTQTLLGREFYVSADTKIIYGTQHDIIIVSISIKDPSTNQNATLTYKFN